MAPVGEGLKLRRPSLGLQLAKPSPPARFSRIKLLQHTKGNAQPSIFSIRRIQILACMLSNTCGRLSCDCERAPATTQESSRRNKRMATTQESKRKEWQQHNVIHRNNFCSTADVVLQDSLGRCLSIGCPFDAHQRCTAQTKKNAGHSASPPL